MLNVIQQFLLKKHIKLKPEKKIGVPRELSAMTSCISVEGSDSEVFTDAPEVDWNDFNDQTKPTIAVFHQCKPNSQELKEAIKKGDVERLGE